MCFESSGTSAWLSQVALFPESCYVCVGDGPLRPAVLAASAGFACQLLFNVAEGAGVGVASLS